MSESKPKVYKASYALQQKVGAGPLDKEAVDRMQSAIDNNDVDFAPIGMQFLGQLEEAVKESKNYSEGDISEFKEKLTAPVMQLKANAAIFHFSLIGNLANVMLSFLEAIQEIDKDVLDIITAHQTTLKAIILKGMKGDGGEIGEVMVKELKDACARYYTKKKAKMAKK